MHTDIAQKFAESLSEKDSTWHKKASEIIFACATVLEYLDDQPEDWKEESCRTFFDSALDRLMDTIATVVDNRLSEVEGYFLSEEEQRQLREDSSGL